MNKNCTAILLAPSDCVTECYREIYNAHQGSQWMACPERQTEASDKVSGRYIKKRRSRRALTSSWSNHANKDSICYGNQCAQFKKKT